MSKKNDLAVTPRPVEGTAVEKKIPHGEAFEK